MIAERLFVFLVSGLSCESRFSWEILVLSREIHRESQQTARELPKKASFGRRTSSGNAWLKTRSILIENRTGSRKTIFDQPCNEFVHGRSIVGQSVFQVAKLIRKLAALSAGYSQLASCARLVPLKAERLIQHDCSLFWSRHEPYSYPHVRPVFCGTEPSCHQTKSIDNSFRAR